MVVLIFFWRRYICPTAMSTDMMYGNEMSTCQLSRMKFSCYNKKNVSRNHNLFLNYLYYPSGIIISVFSVYFVKSNTKLIMCVHMIVFYSHTGWKIAGKSWLRGAVYTKIQ